MKKLLTLALCLSLASCSVPKSALQWQPTSLETRQLQSKYFDTQNEQEILSASIAVFQDLGFIIDETEKELGLIVASKDVSAVDGGQVALHIGLGILTGTYIPYDREQNVRASLVSNKSLNKKGYNVRLTFQRVVWNSVSEVSRAELIKDQELYQRFFDKLSKSVFLEANLINDESDEK